MMSYEITYLNKVKDFHCLSKISFISIQFEFCYVYCYPRHDVDVLEFFLNEASECIALLDLDFEQHALLETSCFTPFF